MEQTRRAKSIYERALAHSDDKRARDSFLAGACGDDAELRVEVERLLESHEASPGSGATTADTSLPEIDAKSVVMERDPAGALGPGVSLR